ncbi:YafY family protein [Sphingomonas sp. PP-CC-3G-468]|uniref:helix-turn-helix transcriptional regulator n=1 Tax=Sphingomonas sp. PP-CC-3G-468 TaxID=2135656 RepID=UPI00104EE80D|nr:YafY family protein [Sphingomonas sp. PP-CC-3G-468]TCM07434.1 WYL domain-containing protein [Sphingomonas sp. PP-CC-3G-468]
MRRADRLFEIIQVLRGASTPLTAGHIASELETSKRTIYRDIDALVAQRVPIRGEAGVGYVLDKGFDLPPLMLTIDEIEAMSLGAQWVIAHADAELAKAAFGVLAKIAAIVPEDLRTTIADPAVGMPPPEPRGDGQIDVARLRLWCREGRMLLIGYSDERGRPSERRIRPFLLAYASTVRVIAAWCELRQDFRIFRTDRLVAIQFLEERYPDRSVTLRRRWLKMIREKHAAENAASSAAEPTHQDRTTNSSDTIRLTEAMSMKLM